MFSPVSVCLLTGLLTNYRQYLCPYLVICHCQHISAISSVCFCYLRQLLLVRRSLTMDAAHALVRAMIHSRLDYCNSLLPGLPTGHMSRLQSVLRAAARLVLDLPGCVPVSAAMHDTLHWLSFPQRVTFKLCLLTCTVWHPTTYHASARY